MDLANLSAIYFNPEIAVCLLFNHLAFAHFVQAHGSLVPLDFSSFGSAWETLHKHYQPFYVYLFFYSTMWILFAAVGVFFIFIEHFEWLESSKIHKVLLVY
jgi:hypothetical protein